MAGWQNPETSAFISQSEIALRGCQPFANNAAPRRLLQLCESSSKTSTYSPMTRGGSETPLSFRKLNCDKTFQALFLTRAVEDWKLASRVLLSSSINQISLRLKLMMTIVFSIRSGKYLPTCSLLVSTLPLASYRARKLHPPGGTLYHRLHCTFE